MTRPTLLKIICGLALLYSFCLASAWDYERAVTEPEAFERVVAEADKQQAENFRRGIK